MDDRRPECIHFGAYRNVEETVGESQAWFGWEECVFDGYVEAWVRRGRCVKAWVEWDRCGCQTEYRYETEFERDAQFESSFVHSSTRADGIQCRSAPYAYRVRVESGECSSQGT